MELTPDRIKSLAQRAAQAQELLSDDRVHPLVGDVIADNYAVLHSHGAWLVRPTISHSSCPWRCSCPDWQYRHQETLGHCKHVLAVILYQDLHPPEVSANPDLDSQANELYH